MKTLTLSLLAVAGLVLVGAVFLRPAAAPEAAPVDMSDAALKERLTRMQYYVTQKDGTEPPYTNAYWNNTESGLYVDVVDGTPLFASTTKYKSGTGWPSFWQPLDGAPIETREDKSLFMTRTEVRSASSDSHLGHVFEDGPEPTGLRYCLNSAALRFVPVADLEAEGYGEYASLFENASDENA
ncbi:peptide-methionine (R)-S-oxide reductase MsrB [Rubrivirga marina]|uniref:Peptide methionine sulfoxide reductase MsrB n=1 Tax=Rubrivirga marina TaxID=1196024 RepID=A0A271J4V1_9BACT|nr:peptide-methionine (R)-S-oxide reductase MsrB [Rubrivirga marina]PAP78307.1 peptide-methionine (R)-S-oxide reductase [Rubrivirga marina]